MYFLRTKSWVPLVKVCRRVCGFKKGIIIFSHAWGALFSIGGGGARSLLLLYRGLHWCCCCCCCVRSVRKHRETRQSRSAVFVCVNALRFRCTCVCLRACVCVSARLCVPCQSSRPTHTTIQAGKAHTTISPFLVANNSDWNPLHDFTELASPLCWQTRYSQLSMSLPVSVSMRSTSPS